MYKCKFSVHGLKSSSSCTHNTILQHMQHIYICISQLCIRAHPLLLPLSPGLPLTCTLYPSLLSSHCPSVRLQCTMAEIAQFPVATYQMQAYTAHQPHHSCLPCVTDYLDMPHTHIFFCCFVATCSQVDRPHNIDFVEL